MHTLFLRKGKAVLQIAVSENVLFRMLGTFSQFYCLLTFKKRCMHLYVYKDFFIFRAIYFYVSLP